MPRVTPRLDKGSVASQYDPSVRVVRGDAWSTEELELARDRITWEMRFRNMPRVTELTYRANSGAEKLDIGFADGSTFDDAFALLAEHRTFVEWAADEMIGTDSDGNTRVPSVQTSINAFLLEAYRRGLVIGTQREKVGEKPSKKDPAKMIPVYSNDLFRIVLRRKVKRVPGWYVAFHEKGIVQDLRLADSEDAIAESADSGEEE